MAQEPLNIGHLADQFEVEIEKHAKAESVYRKCKPLEEMIKMFLTDQSS